MLHIASINVRSQSNLDPGLVDRGQCSRNWHVRIFNFIRRLLTSPGALKRRIICAIYIKFTIGGFNFEVQPHVDAIVTAS